MHNLRSNFGRQALRSWLRLRANKFQFPEPASRYIFEPAEIWILLRIIGAFPLETPVPIEIAPNQQSLDDAQKRLFARNLLQIAADRSVQLTAGLASVIRSTTAPDSVIVANVADNSQFGSFTRTVCFSHTANAAVLNWVDDQNLHHFEAYSKHDEAYCLLAHLWQICNLNFEDVNENAAPPSASEFERELLQLRQTVLLMAIKGVREPEQETYATSWFVCDHRAWLIENPNSAEESLPMIADHSQIGMATLEMVERVLN